MEENETLQEVKDHILVRTWLEQEGGGTEEEDHCLSKVDPQIRQMAAEQLLFKKMISRAEKKFFLLSEGEKSARELIRRHRLAECLFAFVFNLSEEAVREQACFMEHERILTVEALEGICAFLGHPPACPHGRAVPPGECCRLFVGEIRPLVVPLSLAELAQEYQIVFIAPKYHSLLERLGGLGILPGARLKIFQKRPSLVVKVHETEIALDTEIAAGIYVKKITSPFGRPNTKRGFQYPPR